MLGQILQCRRRQALQQRVRAQQAAHLSEAPMLRVRRAARGRVDKSHFIFLLWVAFSENTNESHLFQILS
ncbi:hypothetical protein, partial [Diaphorobacter nitroreducens]|uniref:hypothetical protein n=1 Tax=Diaphorobacter nitroreducens TaxID=164759 RepID=UPI0028A80B8A